MSVQPKLTKKQRKSLAFREKKGKGKAAAGDDEEHAVPEADILDTEEVPRPSEDLSEVKANKGKANVEKEKGDSGDRPRGPTKKRKRTEEVLGTGDSADTGAGKADAEPTKRPSKKKRKESENRIEDDDTKQIDEKKRENARYILFVGNLNYTTTKEAISEHFALCDPPPQVRLLTPKANASTAKSKGCAFLEFSHKNALQQGLKLHQSELDGRRINVELTAGGGGKSEQRINKLKERNRGLATERTKRIQKQHTANGKEGEPETELRPQRHSTTSGIDVVPLKKRTWSVPEGGDDDGMTHRGGKKHTKKRGAKRPAKDWGTGVNAIPVG